MKKLIFIIFTLIHSISAYATGEIFFNGSIVEDTTCQILKIDHKLQIDCDLNNSVEKADKTLSASNLEYIDHEKNLAIMHFTYN